MRSSVICRWLSTNEIQTLADANLGNSRGHELVCVKFVRQVAIRLIEVTRALLLHSNNAGYWSIHLPEQMASTDVEALLLAHVPRFIVIVRLLLPRILSQRHHCRRRITKP